jgi:hypothetical protein
MKAAFTHHHEGARAASRDRGLGSRRSISRCYKLDSEIQLVTGVQLAGWWVSYSRVAVTEARGHLGNPMKGSISRWKPLPETGKDAAIPEDLRVCFSEQ